MLGYPLVNSAEEATANVLRFRSDFEKRPALQERVTLAHDWYAVQTSEGEWAFGFSKFVGHRSNTAALYLRMAKQANGGATEGRLRNWFEPVDPETSLGRELSEALAAFLAKRGRLPRRSVRISILRSELDKLPQAPDFPRQGVGDFGGRISADPRICGGRPCIKGTRMRVSDVVDMLAHGATVAEILEDFPYISEEDIAAALAFAARAVDHRIIRAA